MLRTEAGGGTRFSPLNQRSCAVITLLLVGRLSIYEQIRAAGQHQVDQYRPSAAGEIGAIINLIRATDLADDCQAGIQVQVEQGRKTKIFKFSFIAFFVAVVYV